MGQVDFSNVPEKFRPLNTVSLRKETTGNLIRMADCKIDLNARNRRRVNGCLEIANEIPSTLSVEILNPGPSIPPEGRIVYTDDAIAAPTGAFGGGEQVRWAVTTYPDVSVIPSPLFIPLPAGGSCNVQEYKNSIVYATEGAFIKNQQVVLIPPGSRSPDYVFGSVDESGNDIFFYDSLLLISVILSPGQISLLVNVNANPKQAVYNYYRRSDPSSTAIPLDEINYQTVIPGGPGIQPPHGMPVEPVNIAFTAIWTVAEDGGLTLDSSSVSGGTMDGINGILV